MTTALKVNNLTKEYKQGNLSLKAVNSVSFEIKHGEFVAIVGPSGSGKTTLLAMLATLLTPTSGNVVINNTDLSRMNEKQRSHFRRARIGFTFQANNLIPYLTAQENVELMMRLNGKLSAAGKQKARDLLVRLGLEDHLNKMPNQLSGGQQQRVAIARALVHNPSLVLADEPTASLDTERAYQVVETFASLIHEQNKAGIMVTHDLRMVAYADKVIKMVDGEIAQVLTASAEITQIANGGFTVPIQTTPLTSIKMQSAAIS